MKKLVTVSILVGAFALAGCGKKFNCENLNEKNKECSDAIVKVMLKDMGDKVPEDMKKKLAKRMKEEFAGDKFLKSCKKNWGSDKKSDKEMKEKLEKCFKKDSCDDYAKCLKNTMGK
jgi:hypothetical protein